MIWIRRKCKQCRRWDLVHGKCTIVGFTTTTATAGRIWRSQEVVSIDYFATSFPSATQFPYSQVSAFPAVQSYWVDLGWTESSWNELEPPPESNSKFFDEIVSNLFPYSDVCLLSHLIIKFFFFDFIVESFLFTHSCEGTL